MTPLVLSQAAEIPLLRAQTWASPLSIAIDRYDVQAQAMFVAQVAHESDRFQAMREYWGPTTAQAGYEKRADLGNTRPEAIAIAAAAGDHPGHWFRGVGAIELTGYDNILAFSLDYWGDDRGVHNPALITLPPTACAAAGWYWRKRNIDAAAAPGTTEAFVVVTRKVNGGTNGLEDRMKLWQSAKRAGLQ